VENFNDLLSGRDAAQDFFAERFFFDRRLVVVEGDEG
jgi:hypothetical protein